MAHDDAADRPSLDHAEPRPRLPLPAWMRGWPRGVQPTSLCASRRGVELTYRAPGERWFRVVASRAPQRPGGVEVRGIPGPDPALVDRLAKAVGHRLARSPGAGEWLERAADFVAELSSMAAFGGDSPRHAELDALLACLTQVRAGEALDNLDAVLAAASERLGPATLTELGIALHLANGDDARALALWTEHGPALEARDDRRALACTAMMRAYLGKVEAAQDRARLLATKTRDAIDARHTGELLERLRLAPLAVEQLRLAASDAGGDAGAFDVFHRLAAVATAAREPEVIAEAAAAMAARAREPGQHLLTAQMQREAGNFRQAEATLERVLEDDPEQLEARLLLAGSRLWRGDHEAAAALVVGLAEHEHSEVVRILGACEQLAGNSERARAPTSRALELDPNDDEAKLWRAEALESLGRLSEARAQVMAVTLGDTPIWQLLRARIEERGTPGHRIGLDTWFIVDQNIRQLLGDATPEQTNASHEQALELISAAIARVGGNRSARLSAPTDAGELRWLDGVESPRQRSEQLQLESTQRPVDEVLARFDALAEAHPKVPFFVTYPAELLLWRGEYERAKERFDAVWVATRTRWGYVGSGATAMLLGDDARALEVWEEGKQYYDWIDAEATYCYRGELYRRRGDLELARRDLELAVQARPTRLGAWINLALLDHAEAREDTLRANVARVEELCPAFCWEARLAAGLGERPREALSPDELARWMQTLLEHMRGNRSSVMYTIVDEGLLRVIPVAPAAVWHDYARRALALFEDQLLTQLAARQGL